MNYSSIASSLRTGVESFSSSVSGIKSSSFDSIWSGSAHDTLTSNLTKAVDNINKQKESVQKFADALDKLQEYKDNKEKLDSLKTSLSNTPNTEENASRRSELSNEINSLGTKNSSLKSSIQSTLSSISSVSKQFEVVDYQVSDSDDYKEYVVDLYDFLTLFNSGTLTKMPDGGSGSSLYDYYSKEEVEARLNEIKSQYSGRDAAVNCALGIMKMASDVGLKLDYDWGGGHTSVTSTDAIATGSDCSSFASWAINQGASETFNTKCVSGLVNVGTKTSFENAQKGDILLYSNSTSGHVVMIVDNDPETQQFLVAEASGSNTGVVMKTRSYASLSGKYQARDLSSIYND